MRTLLILVLLLFVGGVEAGPLTPPDAPHPTFKTLDDVAAGVPIRQDMIPMTITEPGRYFLVENVIFSGSGAAITIQAPGVFLDLNGFVIDGLDAHTPISRQGIATFSPEPSMIPHGYIRNGMIRRMSVGGIAASDCLIENMEVVEVAGMGIALYGGLLRNSMVRGVTRSEAGPMPTQGILVARGIAENCLVEHMTGATFLNLVGIRAQGGGTVRNCKVFNLIDENSVGSDYLVVGIEAVEGSIVEGCDVNMVMGRADLASAAAIGIMAGSPNLASSVTVRGNRVTDVYHGVRGIGILATHRGCRVMDNEVVLFPLVGQEGMVAGISVGQDTIVERNVIDIEEMFNAVSLAQYGIEAGWRSVVQENKINLRQSEVSTGRTAIGINVLGNEARILSNLVWVEDCLGPSATGRTIVFQPETVGGYASANVMNAGLVDLGVNTQGSVPAGNYPP